MRAPLLLTCSLLGALGRPSADSAAEPAGPRPARDLGLLSSPVATAVVTGMIGRRPLPLTPPGAGMTARVVSDLTNFHSQPAQGGCEWFGTAPFCNYP